MKKGSALLRAWPGVHGYLASAYALKGDSELTAAELAEARKLGGERWQSIGRIRAGTRYEVPANRAFADATFYKGLRKAGMPKE